MTKPTLDSPYEDIHASIILWKHYKKKINVRHRKCLAYMAKKINSDSLFLQNKKIIINWHLTDITLALIDLFLLSHAEEVAIICLPPLVQHVEVIRRLENAIKNDSEYSKKLIYFAGKELTDIPSDKQKNYFDYILDCGGGLLNYVRPRCCTFELTHIDPAKCDDITHPVISVDQSKTKSLETRYGTGNSFVRLLNELPKLLHLDQNEIHKILKIINENDSCDIYDEMDEKKKHLCITKYHMEQIFNFKLWQLEKMKTIFFKKDARKQCFTFWGEQHYILFGWGHVGSGIGSALIEKAGVPATQIMIVDNNEEKINSLRRDKQFSSCQLVYLPELKQAQANLQKYEFAKKEIKSYLHNISMGDKNPIIVTATGKKDCVSTHFKATEVPERAILFNMGTENEYGEIFQGRVFLDGKPANFALDQPTKPKYIDPTIALHVELILKDNAKEIDLSKYNGFVAVQRDADLKNSDQEMMNRWELFYSYTPTNPVQKSQKLNLSEFFVALPKQLLSRGKRFSLSNCQTRQFSDDGQSSSKELNVLTKRATFSRKATI